MTEPERDGRRRDSDELGNAVRDDQCHIPRRYPVANPERKSGQQDNKIAEGYVRDECSRSMRRICSKGAAPMSTPHEEAATASTGTTMAFRWVRRPGGTDRARQLSGEGRKHDRGPCYPPPLAGPYRQAKVDAVTAGMGSLELRIKAIESLETALGLGFQVNLAGVAEQR
jgi:hypothetical protein